MELWQAMAVYADWVRVRVVYKLVVGMVELDLVGNCKDNSERRQSELVHLDRMARKRT